MLSTIGKVAVVGPGKMAMALVRGWLASGFPADNLVLVHPSPSERTREFAEDVGLRLTGELTKGEADFIMLAVKPAMMVEVMQGLREKITPETVVFSVAAGISLVKMEAGLGSGRVIRTMPNTPSQVGKGVTGVVPGPGVSDEDCEAVDALLSASGLVVWLDDESLIDALTSLSGSGPAYVFHMVEAMAAAGAAQGLPDDAAMALARQTVVGAAALLEADPSDAGTLRENVTSPKGVTYEALKILMDEESGMTPLLTKAMAAAKRRSKELGA